METVTQATGMESITTAVESLMTLAGSLLTTVLANPVLALFFGAGIIGIVFGIIRKAKHM